jgi:aryl-alcohol dehydrogenase-like predicted oxidoreductase
VTYSPLLGGFLTGKYAKGVPPPRGSRGESSPWYLERFNRPEYDFEAVSRMSRMAKEANSSLSDLAVAWILRNPDVTAIILGASRPEQLEGNIKLLDFKPPEGVLERLDVLTRPDR